MYSSFFPKLDSSFSSNVYIQKEILGDRNAIAPCPVLSALVLVAQGDPIMNYADITTRFLPRKARGRRAEGCDCVLPVALGPNDESWLHFMEVPWP